MVSGVFNLGHCCLDVSRGLVQSVSFITYDLYILIANCFSIAFFFVVLLGQAVIKADVVAKKLLVCMHHHLDKHGYEFKFFLPQNVRGLI